MDNLKDKKVEVMILDDEQKKRLTQVATNVIDVLEKETKNIPEKAFVLRVLMETFEETQKCVVPFKNRYTEPVWNYGKKGLE